MISKIIGATALLLSTMAVQAQGVVSPVANPQPADNPEEPAAQAQDPAPAPASAPAAGGFNPFAPKKQVVEVVEVDPNLPPPPPPVDPVVAALAEELQQIREQGERLGVIDGKVIFRHNGRYLVEAVEPDDIVNEVGIVDQSMREAALSGECVIRIVTDENQNNNPPAPPVTPGQSR